MKQKKNQTKKQDRNKSNSGIIGDKKLNGPNRPST
ncbi:spore protein [Oceanobacillus zhaokaii]|nr:spore protein [Oceanobacillus zhaokaii]